MIDVLLTRSKILLPMELQINRKFIPQLSAFYQLDSNNNLWCCFFAMNFRVAIVSTSIIIAIVFHRTLEIYAALLIDCVSK